MGNYNKSISVTGGIAHQLLALLQANNFFDSASNSAIGTECTLYSPSDQSLFTGSNSSVSDSGANKGLEIAASSYDTQRARGMMGNVIDPSQIWLYLATTADIGVRFNSLG